MAETKNLLLFRKWDLSNIEVVDPGLKTAISLRKQILPYTFGRSALKRFNKSEVNIVERLINKSMHFGKKYAKNTGRMTGKKTKLINQLNFLLQLKIPLELFMVALHTMYP
jgi:small subunit ribosomal protein S7